MKYHLVNANCLGYIYYSSKQPHILKVELASSSVHNISYCMSTTIQKPSLCTSHKYVDTTKRSHKAQECPILLPYAQPAQFILDEEQ